LADYGLKWKQRWHFSSTGISNSC